MKCPDDGSPLESRTYETAIQIDECPSCHGVWLDAGELEKVQETREEDHSEALAQLPDRGIRAYLAARQESRPDRQCGKCGRTMEAREYGYCSQIVIDVCPECRGIWLDRGELQALETFYERLKPKTLLSSLVSLFR